MISSGCKPYVQTTGIFNEYTNDIKIFKSLSEYTKLLPVIFTHLSQELELNLPW
jgi:hypothetical protein